MLQLARRVPGACAALRNQSGGVRSRPGFGAARETCEM